MTPHIIRNFLLGVIKKRHQLTGDVHPSSYILAKEYFKLRITIISQIRETILLLLGILSAGFGLKGFLLPNQFLDGGVTGISLLVEYITGVPLAIWLLIINVPFLILGYTQVGRIFAIKSIVAISLLALALTVINYPVITSDKLLIAVFGGFFLGLGIGLAVRGGAVLDGTEVLAVFISRRVSLTMGDTVMIMNIAIFGVAAYLINVETALYAILTYLAASKTVDYIIEGIEEYTAVTIVSSHSDEIRVMIMQTLGRGVTVYLGKRGYEKDSAKLVDAEILYTIITRLEIGKLQTEVKKIDPNAFLTMGSIKDTKGGLIKKRPLH